MQPVERKQDATEQATVQPPAVRAKTTKTDLWKRTLKGEFIDFGRFSLRKPLTGIVSNALDQAPNKENSGAELIIMNQPPVQTQVYQGQIKLKGKNFTKPSRRTGPSATQITVATTAAVTVHRSEIQGQQGCLGRVFSWLRSYCCSRKKEQ